MIIYKITNKINNKIYIGQTVRDLKERIQEHKRNKGCIMYKAFQKYGFENFNIEVIFETEDIEILNEKEKYYIKVFNSLTPNGYNLCEGGSNTKGYRHKEESKKKMSASKKGKYCKEENHFYKKHHTEETKQKMRDKFKDDEFYKKRCEHLNKIRFIKKRKVLCVNTGKEFESIKAACLEYGIKDSTHVSRVCRGKRKSCFGYVFKYVD